MTKLEDFKKNMRDYFKTTVDREEGETFKSWFSALFEALEEEGSVIKTGGETYRERNMDHIRQAYEALERAKEHLRACEDIIRKMEELEEKLKREG